MKTQAQKSDIKRLAFIVAASLIMAVNINTFVHAGGLYPGGFNGLTLLIQKIGKEFLNIYLPFSVINYTLNAFVIILAFKVIGKKFTFYTTLMIVLTGVFTDLIPPIVVTSDVLLIAVFGGIINGFAMSLCLIGAACAGGTDILVIFFSEKHGIDTWNYMLLGNVAMLLVAGVLFGWDKALYSIIFQYTSTQIVQMLHQRYKKHTLFIITGHPNEVYQIISENTNHGATIFTGTGCYEQEKRKMVYSVVSSDEVKTIVNKVRQEDKHAFINSIRTDQLTGHFYQRPND